MLILSINGFKLAISIAKNSDFDLALTEMPGYYIGLIFCFIAWKCLKSLRIFVRIIDQFCI